MRPELQIENPQEEYHLQERQKIRELEDLKAEAEIDRLMDTGGIIGAGEMLDAFEKSEGKLQKGGGIAPACSAAPEGNYEGVRL